MHVAAQSLALSRMGRHDGRMIRDGSLTPANLVGKLDLLPVACTKCDRAGRYPVAKLVERLEPDAKLTNWLTEITADCPRKRKNSFSDQCGALCPDLPKVL
jgi:hypothetical protein